MQLILISDTHGDITYLRDELLPKYASQVDYAIHLGDFEADLFKFRQHYPKLKMVGVGDAFGGSVDERILTINGKKILLIHGHKKRC